MYDRTSSNVDRLRGLDQSMGMNVPAREPGRGGWHAAKVVAEPCQLSFESSLKERELRRVQLCIWIKVL